MIKAYQQGTIDYFCGVYAIINAFRQAAQNQKKLSYREGCLFYQHLIKHLIKKDRFKEVLCHGTDCDLLSDLLKKADRYTQKNFGLSITFETPYAHMRKNPQTVINEIKDFLEQENTAWIIRLNNQSLGDHWSVGTKITPNGIVRLFDSYGAKQFDAKKSLWVPPIKEADKTPDNPTGMPNPPRGKTLLLKEGQVLIKTRPV